MAIPAPTPPGAKVFFGYFFFKKSNCFLHALAEVVNF
jgi:hypothetical protein